MTGRPRSRGSSRCSTAAKNASRSACRIVASSIEHMFARNDSCSPAFNLPMARAWSAELALVGAGGEPVDCWRTLTSHGVADLAPNALDEESRTMTTTLALPRDRARTVAIRAGRPGFARVDGQGIAARAGAVLAKTICTTNCAWSATVRMAGALVSELGVEAPGGRRAFPTASAMAEAGEGFYKDVVRAGYRGPYLRSLAAAVADGSLDLEALN